MDQKRLIYLHRLLNRANSHWTKRMLIILERKNIGWYRSIKEVLRNLNLPSDFNDIRIISTREWERNVKQKIEEKNRQKLIEDCYKKENGTKKKMTKTAHILEILNDAEYTRKPCTDIITCTKQEAKTIMIARFRMLQCGTNFKGTSSETCLTCKQRDDEDHRINNCKKNRDMNLYDSSEKVPFKMIYSHDPAELKLIIKTIESIWNTRNAYGTMIK